MKNLYIWLLLAMYIIGSPLTSQAQCSGSYVYSTVNWDNLDYYFNSGRSSTGPYLTYISDAQEMSQKFAIGRNYLTIATSSNALVNPGSTSAENATHTGEIAGYTGEDVQYNPSANGQFITITFNTPVMDPNFTLYDIDDGAVFTLTATNNLNVATAVNVTTYSPTILTTGIVPLTRTITASATALANNVNQGSATITVPGLVKTITITVTTRGNDPVFWLSDINACVDNGAFPTNWHQTGNNRPFVGPTQNMPDYFLVTPDNDVCYYVDPATGLARQLFQDAARDYVNSFGYDPYNRFLYYISENASVDANNRSIKRYNYNTETTSTIVANITTTLGIPVFDYGVESAGCAFYDGSLYFGIEGGKYDPSGTTNDRTRETIIWRIDFDASNNPTVAYQVAAFDHYNPTNVATAIHDWGDFIIKNGMLYNFNTARNSCGSGCNDYTESKFHHVNLTTGQVTNYTNPNTTSPANRSSWNGQAGMTWAGGLYYFRPASSGGTSQVGLYNETGGIGTPVTITVASGSTAWPGGSGDASDPFRPKCDFGDAPASYDPYTDPATQSPAVHERAENIWLGNTTSEATSWSSEFLKRGTTGTEDSDNGISTLQFFKPGGGDYLAQVSFYNNSGANATIQAWLDYNANGVFDAGEAATVLPATPITSSASVQSRYLYWPGLPSPLTNGQSTYLRVRITSASAGMTTSHPTGYFRNGEVEDYRVIVDNFPLATHLVNFNAALINNGKVKISWTAKDEQASTAYEVQRSSNSTDWTTIHIVDGNGVATSQDYEVEDLNPLKGKSYYRLHILTSGSGTKYSDIKPISIKNFDASMVISPNPARHDVNMRVEVNSSGEANLNIINAVGKVVVARKQAMVSGTNFISIPVTEQLANGSYIVRLQIGDEIVSQKLIINK